MLPSGSALKLLIDKDRPRFEVYAIPHEAKGFALPESGEQRHREQVLVRAALDLFKKALNLIFVQRHDRRADIARQLAGFRGIEPEIADFHRLPERLVKNAVHVLDRFRRERRGFIRRSPSFLITFPYPSCFGTFIPDLSAVL